MTAPARLHRALDTILDTVWPHRAEDDAEFKEAQHPRKEDGKFAKTAGGSGVEMPKGMEHLDKGDHKTVASYANALLADGKWTDHEIAKAVQAQFGSKTSAASIAWYKSQAKKKTPEGIAAAKKKAAGVVANSAAIAQAVKTPAPQTKIDAMYAVNSAATAKTAYASATDKAGNKVFLKVAGVPDGLDTHEWVSKALAKQGYKVQTAGPFQPGKSAPPGGYKDITLSAAEAATLKDEAYTKAAAEQKAAAEKKTAESKLKQPFTELDEKLSDSMVKAVKGYTDGTYSHLNKALRNGQPMTSEQASCAAQLDAALAKAKVKEDTVVYRGLSAGPKFFGPSVTIGTTLIDNGYVSTTKVKEKAWSGTKCAIRLKKGSRALDVQSMSLYPGESEVLLPRGSMFKVTGIDSYGMVELEYVSI